MALGVALSALRSKVKALIGTSLSVDTSDVAAIDTLLNIAQRELACRFHWSHLEVRPDVSVSTQYTALPTTVDFERPVLAYVLDGETWLRLDYGITEEDRSNEGEASAPVRKWQFYNNEGVIQFEVWPQPSEVQTLRFVGQKTFTDMTADGHTCVIDDLLLCFAVAAELLLQYESKAAPRMMDRYLQREVQLRRNDPSIDEPLVLGANALDDYRRERIITVAGGSDIPLFGQTSPSF